MTSFYKCKLDTDGKWEEFPQAFCDLLGYKTKELSKTTIADVFIENDQEQIEAFFHNHNMEHENSSEWEAETKIETKTGEQIPIHATLVGLYDQNGEPGEVLALIHILSKQKELQRKWKATKQQFDSLFHHNPLPVYYYDLDGSFKDANEKLAEFTGLSRDEIIGMNFSDFINGEDLKRATEYFERAKQGQAGQYEIEVIVKNGVKKDIHVTKFPMYLGDEIAGVYGIFEDITEQKKREKELQESEQRFRSMFENNPHSVFYFNTEGTFLSANKMFEELSGYSEEELKKKTFVPFIHPDDVERTQTHFESALNGEVQKYEITGVTQSGDERQVYVTNFPYYRGNEIIGVFGICEDITARKIAERRLKKSEQRWQQLVDHNPQPVMIIQERKIVFINQVGVRYFGASSAKELIGKPVLEFTHPDSLENVKDRLSKLEQNEAVGSGEYKIVLMNGEKRHVETHSIPINYNGEQAIQTVVHDISDLKEKQKIIGKSLKEKETLLQEIHHRVKNNLAVISGLLELQQMTISDEDTISALQDSQLRIQSMAMIHEKLYQSESLDSIGFDAYLQELVESINSTYRSTYKNVSTEFDLDHLRLDLNQAIPCSLIVNEIIVNCYKHAFDKDAKGAICFSLKYDDPEITMEITDDGSGFPEDFEISQQQSLGTTLIHALSNQLNGEMVLENKENGNGTRFKLQFKKKASEQ